MWTIPVSPYPVFAIMTGFFASASLLSSGVNNLIFNKLCTQKYNVSLDTCLNSSFGEAHLDLQEESAQWNNYVSYVQIIPAIISNIMLSSYCDKVGHKLPLLLPLLGSLIYMPWLLVNSLPQYIVSWPMAFILIYAGVYGCFGSFAMVVMASFSYNARITSVENRSIIMALTEASLGVGSIIGGYTSGPLITRFGVPALFGITLGINACIAIIAFFMTDILKNDSGKLSMSDIFGFRRLVDAATAMFHRRVGYRRMLIQMSFASFFGVYCGMILSSSVGFLYFVKNIGFSLDLYSIYMGSSGALITITSTIVLVIVKYLHLNQRGAAIIGAGLCSIGFTINSIGKPIWLPWLGMVFMATQGLPFAVLRTYQSTLARGDELARLFAYEALLQIVLTQLTQIFGSNFYIWTVEFWPGATLALAAGCVIFSIIMMVLSIHVQKWNDQLEYQTLEEPQTENPKEALTS